MINLKQFILLSCLVISTVISAPADTVSTDNSLVITSTESTKPNEVVKETTDMVDDDFSGIKIYAMDVHCNVSNRFASALVTSKVKNFDSKAKEATFSVVLPESAYITGFTMEIEGKQYKAYIKEKEEAKKDYDQAVAQGQAAGHVEAARDSNRFTVSVNVEPQTKATFYLTYEELLSRKYGKYEVLINLQPGQPVKDMNVEVDIKESRPLTSVKVPQLRSGNEVTKNDGKLDPKADIEKVSPTHVKVKFSPTLQSQKEYAKELKTDEKYGLAGQFVVEYDVERDPSGGEVLVSDGYFVHFFAPTDKTPLNKHVTFVLDTSGSMFGSRIMQLKQAMKSILEELKPEDTFNLVEFNSGVSVWDVGSKKAKTAKKSNEYYWGMETTTVKVEESQELPGPVKVTPESIENAKEVVEKFDAQGGTDIQSALQVALDIIKKHKTTNQPMIVFLTDGEPTVGETSTENIIKNITELDAGAVPLFSLSFGDGADRPFLEKLSLKNNAFARHIYDGADVNFQLENFYKYISSPLLSDVEFKYVSSPAPKAPVDLLTRTKLPILFDGSEIVVAGEIVDPGFAPGNWRVWGKGIQGPVELIPKMEKAIGSLERHWAYLTVKDTLKQRDIAEDKKPLTKKALDLALKYSFVTPVSSLVVVKPNQTDSESKLEDASKTGGGFPQSPVFASAGGFPGAPVAFSGHMPMYPRGGGGGFGSFGPAYYMPAPPALHYSSKSGGSYVSYKHHNHPRPLYSFTSSKLESYVDMDMDLATTETSATTALPSPKSVSLDDLFKAFPWLKERYNNGTVKLPVKGQDVELKVGEEGNPATPIECTNVLPNGGAVGRCVSITSCELLLGAPLPTVDKFMEHFCPLPNDYAGVCCPLVMSP